MAIFRCNKCGLLAEQADDQAGQSCACSRCGANGAIYPTLFFIEKLLDRYFAALKENIQLKGVAGESSAPAAVAGKEKIDAIDLANTDFLASDQQHGPIYDWFHKKQIKAEANLRSVDTSGFFDEVAEAIGPICRF